MIADTIQKQIIEALKARDEIRLSTLRMLSSALNYDRIAKQHVLSTEEELAVVNKEAKKRRDAIEIYDKAGEAARSAKEKKELAILKDYLPKELSGVELEEIVSSAVAESGGDFGRTMGLVMAKVKGRADGAKVARVVKGKLG
ncbi:MAG: hypothetical protein ACD_52C00323G0011 [uncultured bacterium]|uniref:Glutamyl-tRNA amidotransferase n=1 Tax=Candidatus Woesebacteria bacterium RIFCSPHIGHO2_12_FULL_41_24 TaxID=1802510 RepID=A0A1F8AUU8_9BACT|nr:MAG: hypothetical protein ACD_52C00323G0011 [uncultured bacterium]OGM14841.1 MAG: hypothetical protein A2W15_00685 [Candidatus Woesebacteria bacterium RBG_16_41_13]OGM30333.1 MAG: hypothetical protein A2873_05390 [Candidatus Woesebacteria bacterium RIFCSPHIGHO2_01_FULL_42_80]OGM34372.1 MAG: hypothetical protein A3D84_04970 [Candidatus Woesebacteria bacterium RIFCSPHIGHO2_02_FULL_42_20]OGM55506.1 MAG: hypothetical protein A3E44_01125 [Candidatus Woesebacteria bacterium RIFCSPHIGHO2_12_FULL_41